MRIDRKKCNIGTKRYHLREHHAAYRADTTTTGTFAHKRRSKAVLWRDPHNYKGSRKSPLKRLYAWAPQDPKKCII